MAKKFRVLSLLLVCCVAAAILATLATPALSQASQQALLDAQAKVRELESRRNELTTAIAEKETAVANLRNEITNLSDTITVNNTHLELLADQLERTVHQRHEPETTRIEIAIVGFKKNGLRQGGLIDEIRALDRNTAETQRRVLYESVIADSTGRLATLNTRLGELTDELIATRQRVSDLETQLSQNQDNERDLNEEIATAKTELQDTLTEIQNTTAEIERLESGWTEAILTGLIVETHDPRPALVVKIDNVSRARPQAGINQADIVFVEQVEHQLTRLAAVFHSTSPGQVGPVRSMRTSDFDLLAQFNQPLFANSGGNRGTRAALARSSLVNIGVGAAPDLYYRSSSRRAPHNLFTNTDNLWALSSDLSNVGLPSPTLTFRDQNEPINPAAIPVNSININYGNTTVQYSWNGSGWNRTQNGAAMVDNRGVRTSPTTVIVQVTQYGRSAADSRSPEAITVGSGRALVFSDGQLIEGTWSRANSTDPVIYRDDQGERISILPGRTWIELPRANATTYS